MKNIPLYYWNNHKNFGDELSKYIVEKISSKNITFAPETKKNKLFAIGSILNCKTIYTASDVWGSGILHRRACDFKFFPISHFLCSIFSLFQTKNSIYAVRGPLTREILVKKNFNVPEVYGDPGILAPLFYQPKSEKGDDIGIILHLNHSHFISQKKQNGIRFISLEREGNTQIEQFIDEIYSCRKIFSTSLHGVIVAQAYGIPAQWLQIEGSEIHRDQNFKFTDYFLGAKQEVQKPLIVKSIDVNQLDSVQIPAIKSFDIQPLLNSFPKKYL